MVVPDNWRMSEEQERKGQGWGRRASQEGEGNPSWRGDE